jgi:type I restriction enzyme R subunit
MEHAIRKHCKVHFEEDPAFYQRLSEKLEALILKHKEDWDELVRELFGLRAEAEAGRQEEVDGVSAQAAPFYDLMGQIAFGDGVPEEHSEAIKDLMAQIIDQLRETIGIINFWANGPEVHALRGKLSDLMLFSGIDEIADKSDTLVTEITALAKKRHEDLVR